VPVLHSGSLLLYIFCAMLSDYEIFAERLRPAWTIEKTFISKSVRRVTWIGLAIVLLLVVGSIPQSQRHISEFADTVKGAVNENVCLSGLSTTNSSLSGRIYSPPPEMLQSKYAYAVFLDDYSSGPDKDDLTTGPYFLGVRMLIYQLLHDPETRGNGTVPFLVLVHKGYSPVKRRRLELDGAQILEVPEVKWPDWMSAKGLVKNPRWRGVLSKLHILRQTQYDKILILDADIVILKAIDDIFLTPETAIAYNRNLTNAQVANVTRDDEGIQPSSYMLAGFMEKTKNDLPDFNAGFVVLHPSQDLFDHHMKVLQCAGRFDPSYPEQNLWNYIHRKSGNLPWAMLPELYAAYPNEQRLKAGLRAMHWKWWGAHPTALPIRDMGLRSRNKMEGYWNGLT
jgi:hypothetical protein